MKRNKSKIQQQYIVYQIIFLLLEVRNKTNKSIDLDIEEVGGRMRDMYGLSFLWSENKEGQVEQMSFQAK